MWDRLRYTWLPVCCFAAALLLSLALVAAVVLAPSLSPRGALVRLFAEDGAVRKTALGSAAGLAATAFVFFRPSGPRPRKPSSKDPTPGNMAGA